MTDPHVVRVCGDGACPLRNAYAFADHLRDVFEPADDVEVRECRCLGLCDAAPAVTFNDVPLSPETLEDLAEQPSDGPCPPPGSDGPGAGVIVDAAWIRPGRFHDARVLETQSALVVEGLLAACGERGATQGAIAIRREHAPVADVVRETLARAGAASDLRLDVRLVPGHVHPYAVSEDRPLAATPDVFARTGQAEPRWVSLSGDVVRPGAYRIPRTTTYRALIESFGGGVPGGAGLQAISAGGAASPTLYPAAFDRPVETDVVLAIDEERDLLQVATNLVRFFLDDTEAIRLLERVLREEGRGDELERLREIDRELQDTDRANALEPVLSLTRA